MVANSSRQALQPMTSTEPGSPATPTPSAAPSSSGSSSSGGQGVDSDFPDGEGDNERLQLSCGSPDDATGFTTTAVPSGTITAASYGYMNNTIGGGSTYGIGSEDHDSGVGPSQYAMGSAVTNCTNSS
jgi:hypothetical protein